MEANVTHLQAHAADSSEEFRRVNKRIDTTYNHNATEREKMKTEFTAQFAEVRKDIKGFSAFWRQLFIALAGAAAAVAFAKMFGI